jgi:hypothetical protein
MVSLVTFCHFSYGKEETRYVVEEPGSLVKMVKGKSDLSGIQMRDPNLDSANVRVPVKPQTKKPAKVRVEIVRKETNSIQKFKSLKVAASVRLPRVEFGKTALPLGIRNETPSVNFVKPGYDD